MSLRTRTRGPHSAILALALLFSLCSAVMADDCSKTPARWTQYPTPTHEDLLVLPGSDIDSFTAAGSSASTLYAIGTCNNPCQEDLPPDPFTPPAGLFNEKQTPRFWKSDDGGATWHDMTDRLLEATGLPNLPGNEPNADFLFFTTVSSPDDNANFVVVAGYDSLGQTVVVGSDDGGETFHYVGCGGVAGLITSADVSIEVDDERLVALGTSDETDGGKVWLFQLRDEWTGTWIDTSGADGWATQTPWNSDPTAIKAVVALEFSPSFASDRTMLALILAEAREEDGDYYDGFYLVRGSVDEGARWNSQAGYEGFPVLVKKDNTVVHAPSPLPDFLLRMVAAMAVPADFDGNADDSSLLVVVNGAEWNPSNDSMVDEGGFLFRITGRSVGRDLLRHQDNPWVSSVAYHGLSDMRGTTLLGEAFPHDWQWSDITDWLETDNPDMDCCAGCRLLRATALQECCPEWIEADPSPTGQWGTRIAFAPDGTTAFAATSGEGRVWHEGNWYADESAFSTSAGDEPGTQWEQQGMVDTMIHRIEDINYEPDTACLHVHTSHEATEGSVCDCESVWLTCDEGDTYSRVMCGMPDVSDLDDEAFEDIMDDYHRGFYRPRTEGARQTGGVRYVIGDAIDDDDDELLAEEFDADTIYRQFTTAGAEWQEMGALTLDYKGLLLMACEEAEGSVLYVGFDNLWWDFTANRPLPYEEDGTDPACSWGHDCRKLSGAARCLDPDIVNCCEQLEWDYLVRGLNGTETTDGTYEHLELAGGNCSTDAIRLWAIDKDNRYWSQNGQDTENYDWCQEEFANPDWGRLWIYDDCFAVEKVEAADETMRVIPSDPCVCDNEEFSLEWSRPCCACEYELEIALDEEFRHIVLTTNELFVESEGENGQHFFLPPDPCSPDLIVGHGMLDCNEQHWWRARARVAESGEVIRTWWSEPVSFRTAPGPVEELSLLTPCDGATRVAVNDVAFSWDAIGGVTDYDFMLVDIERGHVASKVGDFTTVMLPGPLAHDTSYIWRVIALDGEQPIAESGEATFRTKAQETPVTPTTLQPTYVPPERTTHGDWVVLLAGVVLALLLGTLAALSYANLQRRRQREARSADLGSWPE